MDHLDLLHASAELTQRVIDRTDFDPTTLALPTPCRSFDVAALVDHIIGTHHFLLTAAGGSAPDDGAVNERHQAVTGAAVAVWSARGTDGTVDLAGNELPASFALALHGLEAFVHGWDLATALGHPFAAPDDLVEIAWDAAEMIVSDDNRGTGPDAPYGPEVAAPAGAGRLDALIAFTGRTP